MTKDECLDYRRRKFLIGLPIAGVGAAVTTLGDAPVPVSEAVRNDPRKLVFEPGQSVGTYYQLARS